LGNELGRTRFARPLPLLLSGRFLSRFLTSLAFFLVRLLPYRRQLVPDDEYGQWIWRVHSLTLLKSCVCVSPFLVSFSAFSHCFLACC
jgi:hypothetical protein